MMTSLVVMLRIFAICSVLVTALKYLTFLRKKCPDIDKIDEIYLAKFNSTPKKRMADVERPTKRKKKDKTKD